MAITCKYWCRMLTRIHTHNTHTHAPHISVTFSRWSSMSPMGECCFIQGIQLICWMLTPATHSCTILTSRIPSGNQDYTHHGHTCILMQAHTCTHTTQVLFAYFLRTSATILAQSQRQWYGRYSHGHTGFLRKMASLRF